MTPPEQRSAVEACRYIFHGTRNVCGAWPTHPVHIYGQWSGPEEYHAFVPATEPAAPMSEPGMCECGQDMDAHAGGFALLHHDEFIAAQAGPPPLDVEHLKEILAAAAGLDPVNESVRIVSNLAAAEYARLTGEPSDE